MFKNKKVKLHLHEVYIAVGGDDNKDKNMYINWLH